MNGAKKLIIIGAATPTIIRVIEDINSDGNEEFQIVGFLDNRYLEIGDSFYDLPLLGGFESIEKFDPAEVLLINTIASSTSLRRTTSEYFLQRNYRFTNVIHPSVNLERVVISEGNLIYENATVHPFVSIGSHNVISSNAGIAHEVELNDYVFVGPGSYTCGKCRISCGAYIGVGAKILPRLTVGLDSVVGAGAIVTKNVPDAEKHFGVPARKS